MHAVLERLFDLPAAERTLATAREHASRGVAGAFSRRRPRPRACSPRTPTAPNSPTWLASAETLLGNYFELEDPTRFEPQAREQLVEVVIDGLRLRGYVDRLDVTPSGDIRVVDYKTGATPREAFEAKALFQMKFYALVLWRTRGVVPRQLRLIYLADTDTLSYAPDVEELERFERTLKAIWAAIERATQTGDFRPEPEPAVRLVRSPRAVPGVRRHPPPFPVDALAAAQDDRRAGRA